MSVRNPNTFYWGCQISSSQVFWYPIIFVKIPFFGGEIGYQKTSGKLIWQPNEYIRVAHRSGFERFPPSPQFPHQTDRIRQIASGERGHGIAHLVVPTCAHLPTQATASRHACTRCTHTIYISPRKYSRGTQPPTLVVRTVLFSGFVSMAAAVVVVLLQ